jgi:hypothetical protein
VWTTPITIMAKTMTSRISHVDRCALLAALLLASATVTCAMPAQGMMGGGSSGSMGDEMDTIQNLMQHHTEINRNVTYTAAGIKAHTSSKNPQVGQLSVKAQSGETWAHAGWAVAIECDSADATFPSR